MKLEHFSQLLSFTFSGCSGGKSQKPLPMTTLACGPGRHWSITTSDHFLLLGKNEQAPHPGLLKPYGYTVWMKEYMLEGMRTTILIVADNHYYYYYFSIITAYRILKVLLKVFFKQSY